MAKRIRFFYETRTSSKRFRGFDTKRNIETALDTGHYHGAELSYIQGATFNYDFELQRPRIDSRSISFSEKWYSAEWQQVDPSVVQPNLP